MPSEDHNLNATDPAYTAQVIRNRERARLNRPENKIDRLISVLIKKNVITEAELEDALSETIEEELQIKAGRGLDENGSPE